MTIYAFTDVHGHYDLMRSALDYIRSVDANPRFIGLGDYVDRGPRSPEIIDYLMEHPEIECLMGNHETMMIDAFEVMKSFDAGQFPSPRLYTFWVQNGGFATEQSYNGDMQRMAKHVDWMRDLKVIIETPSAYFVHAGLNPERPMDQQRVEDVLWIREKFLNANHNFGKHVVHGHTPRQDIEVFSNRTNLDVGTPFNRRMAMASFEDNILGPVTTYLFEDNDDKLTVTKRWRGGSYDEWMNGIKFEVPNDYRIQS